ncbi:MAG: MBL fold metallo-hydrolase [Bdellovibrionaceae bacterium]|nr:MBL fold metallo-hydrolase [Pseudobdellovibrionaceae bacterium]
MKIQAFFDEETYTLTYAVFDPQTKDAVIIDPVMDYEPASSSYFYDSINKVMEFVQAQQLNVVYIIETHAHADHLSGSQELKRRLSGAQVLIGEEIKSVQSTFKDVFHLDDDFKTDGSQFDRLVGDGEVFKAGSLEIKAIHTPGHTEACYSYLIEDAVFTGDALFMPDYGVARCDFPKGSAETLYRSVTEKLYQLPESTRVYTAHDYQPGGRPLRFESTIGESKKSNIHINETTQQADFVKFREARDRTLSAPKLLLPSVQVNVDGGHFPEPEANGMSYLKIPVSQKND